MASDSTIILRLVQTYRGLVSPEQAFDVASRLIEARLRAMHVWARRRRDDKAQYLRADLLYSLTALSAIVGPFARDAELICMLAQRIEDSPCGSCDDIAQLAETLGAKLPSPRHKLPVTRQRITRRAKTAPPAFEHANAKRPREFSH